MAGKQKLFLPLAFILAAASITTFSKAAWLLVLLGLLSNLLALHLQQDATGEARRRTQAMRYVVPLVAVISFVFYLYGELIVSLVDFKIESTKDIGSVETRANLLLAGAYAVLDHPLLGLGFGNYYKVEGLYSQIELPPLSREDNAHNVFAQVAATAGLPALILLVAIILFTFWHFRKMLQIKIHGSRYVKSLYLLISVSIFVLFGSVQLQLIAQPAFWFFSAIILGMCQSLNVGKSKRSFSRP
jgi:O-antigen ligase